MIFVEQDIYTQNGHYQEMPGFDEKYANIVDYILRITDDIWEEKNIHVINQTYTNDIIIHVGATIINGIEFVINGTIQTLYSFPDRQMNGETVIWAKEASGHFFSSHRIGSYATNEGQTVYGEATGEKVFFRTIADCAVYENKIYEEWLVRDNLVILEQLGFDPIQMAKLDTKYNHKKSLAYKDQAIESISKHSNGKSSDEKSIENFIHLLWSTEDMDTAHSFYHDDALIHTIQNLSFDSKNYIDYINKIKSCFSHLSLDICRITKNKRQDDIECAVRWKITATHSHNGFFGEASQVPLFFYGISHFILKDELIKEECTIFDAYDILCQIHADDQLASPKDVELNAFTELASIKSTQNKVLIKCYFDSINDGLKGTLKLERILSAYCKQNVTTICSDPIGECLGIESILDTFWTPLIASFPDLEIQPYIIIGGIHDHKECISVAGNMLGTFTKDWLTIPANKQVTSIRFSMQLIIQDGQIVNQWIYLDVLAVIRQAGFQLFDAKGVDQVAPSPLTQDGLQLQQNSINESRQSFDLVNAMIDGLLEYDGQHISSMNMKRFWDSEKMMWYGPSPIGTTRGLQGFEEYHQKPFLKAFPNRGVDDSPPNVENINIADGQYVCHFGHELMYGNHSGDGWLGLKATGIDFRMSVQDFWRREGDKLVENWVMLDLVNVLKQFGIDVFQLLENQKRAAVL